MEVGEYVRTDKGLIGKVIKKEEYDTHFILEYKGQYCKRVLTTSGTDSEIVKSSPNIIDVIEVGDYVNGLKAIQMYSPEGKYTLWIKLSDNTFIDNSEEIKSIATKEQFKNIEYEVK